MENWATSAGELEKKIGYSFKDKKLLQQALTHSSFANEQRINRFLNYERLEFLGDAVLELVASQYLFETYPEMPEGQMTKLRSTMVCEPALAYCAKDIELEQHILLGRGEEQTGGRFRDSIVSDVMEAVIGAVYLDSGLGEAQTFIHTFILSDLEHKQLFLDSKSIIQERIQQNGLGQLRYELIAETGPEHQKEFYVELYLEENKIGTGSGRSKKTAEQQAAYQALLFMKAAE